VSSCVVSSLTGISLIYDDMLKESAEKLGKLKSMLTEAGFPEGDLKTVDFRVDTKYENDREMRERRFTGFAYTHALKIKFAADNRLLGKFISAVSSSGTNPEFSFSYTVGDVEAAKERLLKEAVNDCIKKALAIASAAKVELVCISGIEYEPSERCFETMPVRSMRAFGAASCDAAFDVTPEDIELSDTVTVCWQIG